LQSCEFGWWILESLSPRIQQSLKERSKIIIIIIIVHRNKKNSSHNKNDDSSNNKKKKHINNVNHTSFEFKRTTSKLHPFIGKRREMNGTAFADRNFPLFEATI
jgi:hypothetical protein